MKILSTISFLILLSFVQAQAGKPAPIELKAKSSFDADASGRNPFWPIGFKPVAKSNKGDHAASDIQPTAFVLSSITLGQQRFAIINGKTLVEGQQFGLLVAGQTYQLTVKAIEDGRVVLARRDQEIIVPLRRK